MTTMTTAPTTGTPVRDFPVQVRVAAVRTVAERIVELRLEPADDRPLPAWTPGAHVDVALTDELVRQYSLCSDPGDPHWRLAVLREEEGRGGPHHVHCELSEGSRLALSEPRNTFPLRFTGRRLLFVAGGIGITPILPMLAAAAAAGADFTLLHLARSESAAAYVEEVAAYGDRVVRHVDAVSGPIDLAGVLEQYGAGEADVYACGPAGLLTAMEAYAEARPSCVLHTERFASDEPAVRAGDTAFTVELADGMEVEVAADKTILQALSEAGVRVLNSCQEGVCGTCETPVIEGTPDHRDHVLSPEERAGGEMMMPCVSRCLGKRLVLDL